MKFRCLFKILAGISLITSSLVAPSAATAQTVVSNETLVTTTFVVNKQSATANCGKSGCRAKTPMFAPVSVLCPAATGKTCTFHISLDAKTSIGGLPCSLCYEQPAPVGFYQFLVDGVAPTIGPTDKNGVYWFEKDAVSDPFLPVRQSYSASILASVTNSNSNSHTIALNVGCWDDGNIGSCGATAHWSTMRVDVFEP